MANSIEVRSPFLDYRVVEWAARLPEAALLNTQQGKLPLRALGERFLPAGVQQGRKRGFGVPLDQWLRNPDGQRFVRERLLAPEARQSGLYDPVVVEKLLVNHAAQRGREYGGLLWRLLMLDAWARQYLRSSSFMAGPPV
jgi:asparagine synthase (glutamine-hydrolysing)